MVGGHHNGNHDIHSHARAPSLASLCDSEAPLHIWDWLFRLVTMLSHLARRGSKQLNFWAEEWSKATSENVDALKRVKLRVLMFIYHEAIFLGLDGRIFVLKSQFEAAFYSLASRYYSVVVL